MTAEDYQRNRHLRNMSGAGAVYRPARSKTKCNIFGR
jgi:hypothetical protein